MNGPDPSFHPVAAFRLSAFVTPFFNRSWGVGRCFGIDVDGDGVPVAGEKVEATDAGRRGKVPGGEKIPFFGLARCWRVNFMV